MKDLWHKMNAWAMMRRDLRKKIKEKKEELLNLEAAQEAIIQAILAIIGAADTSTINLSTYGVITGTWSTIHI